MPVAVFEIRVVLVAAIAVAFSRVAAGPQFFPPL